MSFWSSTLSKAEQEYDARERECLGIIRACEHFNPTISMCKQLLIECDHQPLSYLANCDHQARLYRWNLRLQRFAPFTVVHLPGWLNGPPADGLSRYLTSRFDCKQLSETLYGSKEDLIAPPVEHISVLITTLRSWPLGHLRSYQSYSCFTLTVGFLGSLLK